MLSEEANDSLPEIADEKDAIEGFEVLEEDEEEDELEDDDDNDPRMFFVLVLLLEARLAAKQARPRDVDEEEEEEGSLGLLDSILLNGCWADSCSSLEEDRVLEKRRGEFRNEEEEDEEACVMDTFGFFGTGFVAIFLERDLEHFEQYHTSRGSLMFSVIAGLWHSWW